MNGQSPSGRNWWPTSSGTASLSTPPGRVRSTAAGITTRPDASHFSFWHSPATMTLSRAASPGPMVAAGPASGKPATTTPRDAKTGGSLPRVAVTSGSPASWHWSAAMFESLNSSHLLPGATETPTKVGTTSCAWHGRAGGAGAGSGRTRATASGAVADWADGGPDLGVAGSRPNSTIAEAVADRARATTSTLLISVDLDIWPEGLPDLLITRPGGRAGLDVG
jgi:hypothetical protein